MKTRKIVKIDPSKCDGCGLCVPNCAEGAIRVIEGKATLMADNLCDGLGACLGHCPQDALTIEERAADEFDVAAVEEVAHHKDAKTQRGVREACDHGGAAAHAVGAREGCPGARMRTLSPARPATSDAPTRPSALGHWPVQLALVPTAGPMWQDADVLICADCVPFAMPDFHERLLAGRALAIACPKLDDVQPYIDKLAAIFAGNAIRSVTVAHMEVPCCRGIVYVVQTALKLSRRDSIPLRDVTVGVDGNVREHE